MPTYPIAFPSLPTPPLPSRPLFTPRDCPPGFDEHNLSFRETLKELLAFSRSERVTWLHLAGLYLQHVWNVTLFPGAQRLWQRDVKKRTSWKSSPAPRQFSEHQRPAHCQRKWWKQLGIGISGARYSKMPSAGGHLRRQLGKWRGRQTCRAEYFPALTPMSLPWWKGSREPIFLQEVHGRCKCTQYLHLCQFLQSNF